MLKSTFLRLFFILLLFITTVIHAELRLPKIIGDGMILQRGTNLRIWGWANAGERIKVRFRNKNYSTTTSSSGKWIVSLPPAPAGGPYPMVISGREETISLKDILIGDVWFCSGQSNMVHYLELHNERYANEIATANYPEIRQFLVPTNPALQGLKQDIPEAAWKSARGNDVRRFSVVAYFFAKELYEKYQVPIGIINSSVGGTPIEAWTSADGLTSFPELTAAVEQNSDTAYVNQANRKAARIQQQFEKSKPEDKGLSGNVPWNDPALHMTGWQRINIPGYWEDQGVRDLNGVVWYRREVEIPETMTGMAVKVALGRIVDADQLYVNGELTGQTTYQYPQRRYDISSGLLHQGMNTLAIRVVNNRGKGGFVPDKPYYLATTKDTIDLKGYWNYRVGAVYDDPPANTGGIFAQNQPAALFNGMVAPFTDYALRGVVWYQGESNTGNPQPYAALQRALISDWRNQWKQPEMPFLYVQLPNYMEVNYSPSESNWAQVRQAQLDALNVPNTAMAVAIDLGEWNDVHPDNKKPVSERLALAARHLVYGEKDLVYSGPVYSSANIQNDTVVLHFTHTGDGLISGNGEDLKWFALAGADRKFVWADAEIQDENVVLNSTQVDDAVFVRYAWADNPEGGLLYNREGLPASPFEAQLLEIRRGFNRDSIARLSEADHRQMKKQLDITAQNRPGPSGNPDAPNAANTNESNVNTYTLPDLLVLNNGEKVTSPDDWWEKRRPEIVEDFNSEVYGRLPENIPPVEWKVIAVKDTTIGRYPAREKTLKGVVDNSSYPAISVEMEMQLIVPANTDEKVPVVLEFGFIRWPFGSAPTPGNPIFSTGEPSWKEQVLSRGWGYAILVPNSIQADYGAGLREGIIGLVNKGEFRNPDDWGSLRAWAWGASTAVDYFETDPNVDTKRLAIEGLSRYGKAALVAMAFEPRFSLSFIGSSGAGGASLLRRKFGEQLENLASSGEYHWFSGNFIKYASSKNTDDLPVDAHELIALCAPRPVFISAGSPHVEGRWIDAKGMFLAAVAAGPAYKLLGKQDLGTQEFPPLGTSLTNGELAFRQHAGGHTTGPNWSIWLAWACRYWKNCKL